jgi:TonB-dependent SusC/RagA subfamily outer membrane receptor
VAGLLRAEIVVPRWLLSSPPEEQSLVLAHEEEHRRAGDPLLLAGACLAVVLLPWHPAVWWMASRLRLATEIDCDARVLRRGARPLAYGSLLIDIAGRCAGSLPGVPAIAGSRSHLERRLHAMIPRNRRFGLLRGGALGALAVVATLAACEASMPTAADVARMDVSTAERGAKRLALLPVQVNAEYFIDGQSATAEQAHALAPERIEAMQVLKRRVKVDASSPAAEQGTSQIRILTKDAPESVRAAFERERPGIYHRADTMVYVLPDLERSSSPIVAEPEAAAGESHMKIRSTDGGPEPLLFIDGVRSAPEAMSKLPPARIQKVEVLKGPAATKLYGSEAAGGVIRITTNER